MARLLLTPFVYVHLYSVTKYETKFLKQKMNYKIELLLLKFIIFNSETFNHWQLKGLMQHYAKWYFDI